MNILVILDFFKTTVEFNRPETLSCLVNETKRERNETLIVLKATGIHALTQRIFIYPLFVGVLLSNKLSIISHHLGWIEASTRTRKFYAAEFLFGFI